MGPICGYCKRCQKNQQLLWRLYVGIATNEECRRLFVPYMRVLQLMQNACGYFGLICKYCILENGFMEFIIENDVGILCLKCVDYF